MADAPEQLPPAPETERVWFERLIGCPKCRVLVRPIDSLLTGRPFIFAFGTCTFVCRHCNTANLLQITAPPKQRSTIIHN